MQISGSAFQSWWWQTLQRMQGRMRRPAWALTAHRGSASSVRPRATMSHWPFGNELVGFLRDDDGAGGDDRGVAERLLDVGGQRHERVARQVRAGHGRIARQALDRGVQGANVDVAHALIGHALGDG